MLKNSSLPFSQFRHFKSNFAWINDVNQWFIQWDFKFYQWLDEIDYYEQNAFFQKIKFKREWIYSILPLLMALFMLIYFIGLKLKKKTSTEMELLWHIFAFKMKKRGVSFELTSIAESRRNLDNQEEEAKMVFEDLVRASFQSSSPLPYLDLKKRIRRL